MTLVSCIMPTANRRAYMPHAIDYFLRQDHAERELVILDDGEDAVADLIPADPRIRYLRETRRRTTGAKRNACVEAARGEVIIHWDDDDWYAADRISRQLAALEGADADLCGMESLLFFDPMAEKAWLYRYPGRDAAWVCGVSMAYRRALWARNPFPHLQVGEDSHFIWNARDVKAVRMGESGLIAAMVHGANTSPRRTEGSAWSPRGIGEIQALIGEDWTRYSGASPAPTPAPAVAIAHRQILIGVHGAEDAIELATTLRALRDHNDATADVTVLGASTAEQATAQAFGATFVHAPDKGGAAAFNRLAQTQRAAVLILLEGGARPGPGWLSRLLAAFDDPAVGLAGPSTNRHWTDQGAFAGLADNALQQVRAAQIAASRFAGEITPAGPLHGLGAFCYAVRREVIEAIGAADEGFGGGPCWEMEYSARAARAGFRAVWAGASYVHRAAATPARQEVERLSFQAARERYQDRLCGLRLSGDRTDYADHCRGDDCPHFAPADHIEIHRGFDALTVASRASPVPRPTEPLVSCVMPTGNRRDWALQSIRYFERQTWTNRELIIVDDGREPLDADLPCDPRIRYVRSERVLSIGAKRNLACDMARGDYIVLWDDDDWHGLERIARQLAPIRAGRAQITALRHAPFLEVATGSWWRCAADFHRRIFLLDVMGGTQAFPRALFAGGCRFPDSSMAEDAAFLRAAVHSGARLEPIDAEDLYVYVRHGANTWRFTMSQGLTGGWAERAAPKAIGPDLAFYMPRVQRPA
ncbi:glycosyltransferase [Phenylobacterium immobile]|uniref:glycosyltransferase n=1 Tax=Phenylobacterium immobile TaxID=21 RepID=UPI000A3DE67F|nr:glycosyltransferase [Phenylobacterium immobile]